MQNAYWIATMIGLGIVILAIVIPLNIWNNRRRDKMTPAERAIDDVETRREANVW